MLLHTSSFAQRFFYTQVLLHRHTLTHTGRSFTHKYSCTVSFLDTGAFSHMHTRMLFHRDVFKRACLYTEVFSHKGTFTQRFSCTEMLSHTRTLFYTHILVHTHTPNSARKSSASRCKTRISPFDLGAFRAKGFCERKQHVNFTVFFFQPSNRNFTAVLTIETLKGYAKLHFRQFSRIETHFVGKGWPGSNPHCNFTSVFEDRHFVREGCVSWTSIHAALQPSEKIGFFF